MWQLRNNVFVGYPVYVDYHHAGKLKLKQKRNIVTNTQDARSQQSEAAVKPVAAVMS